MYAVSNGVNDIFDDILNTGKKIFQTGTDVIDTAGDLKHQYGGDDGSTDTTGGGSPPPADTTGNDSSAGGSPATNEINWPKILLIGAIGFGAYKLFA